MLFQNKTSPKFFEDRYRKQADPWDFTNSAYEQGRFDRIIAALNHRRYSRAFEPGCSIGTLTGKLASLCDHIDASDFSETAVSNAQQRCAALPQAHFTVAALKEGTSLAGYDLVVFSEIGYYFRFSDWQKAVHHFASTLDHGATLIASHWTGHSKDHRIEGDQVHEVLRAEPTLRLDHEERNPGFRLDRFTKL